MELLSKAKNSNDFGLRKMYPWTDLEKYPPWTTIVTDPLEKSFVASKVNRTNAVIKRVENPYLWARYVLRYEELNANECYNAVSEHIVIHATTFSNATNIADVNFDWRRVHRARFGQGVSFAGDVQYAKRYASDNEAIIVAGILIGNITIGGYETKIPSKDYDTTRDNRSFVYVKYYDDDFYPYYIVE